MNHSYADPGITNSSDSSPRPLKLLNSTISEFRNASSGPGPAGFMDRPSNGQGSSMDSQSLMTDHFFDEN